METSKKLLRRHSEGPIGGVASGIANYLQVEPIWIQIAFGVTLIFNGAGLFLYLAGWLLIPEPTSQQTASITITTDTKKVLAAVVVLIIGVALFSDSFGRDLSFFGSAALVAIGGVLLFRNTQEKPIATTDPLLGPPAPTPTTSTKKELIKSDTAQVTLDLPETETSKHWATPQTTEPEVLPKPTYPPITVATLTLTMLVAGIALLLRNLGLGIGTVGIIGLATITIGIGILCAAIWGKPAKLIVIAVCALPAFIVVPLFEAINKYGAGYTPITVVSEENLKESYTLGVGELELNFENLTITQDPTIAVSSEAGGIIMYLPENIPVEVSAEVLFGELQIFDERRGGIQNKLALTDLEDSSKPTLYIEAETTYGLIEIHRSNERHSFVPENPFEQIREEQPLASPAESVIK